MQKLKFSRANSKLSKLAKLSGKNVFSLDLLAGKTCCAAKDCLAWTQYRNGKTTVKDGPGTRFRCYAASLESLFPKTYMAHKYNTDLLRNKTATQISQLILTSLPPKAEIIRLHSSGDFLNKEYFYGVLKAAQLTPHIKWYTYTKCLHYVQEYIGKFGAIDIKHGKLLDNFYITASYGGKYDSLIEEIQIRSTKVVLEEDEAARSDTLIDTTDSFASSLSPTFSMLIHGTNPPNSAAAKAVAKLRKKKKNAPQT